MACQAEKMGNGYAVKALLTRWRYFMGVKILCRVYCCWLSVTHNPDLTVNPLPRHTRYTDRHSNREIDISSQQQVHDLPCLLNPCLKAGDCNLTLYQDFILQFD